MATRANINEVYAQVNSIINKSQKGGYISEPVFNRYAKLAQLDWLNSAYERYDSGQKNWDDISLLRAKPKMLTVDSNGEFSYPSDYWHTSEIWNPFNKMPVDVISDNERPSRQSSELLGPSSEHPVAILYDTYVQVLPTDLLKVEFSYLKEPLIPFWNYTVSSNRKVYAATSGAGTNPNSGVTSGDSTDFQIPIYATNDLAYRIVQYAAANIRDNGMIQMSEAKKNSSTSGN